MSSVKITELQQITTLNANTSNTIFVGVDIPTGVTGKITATTLAQRLYANNVLNVGNNSVIFPNVVAQFTGSSDLYLQMNMQNFGSQGSGDIVITADKGTDSNSFIDLGINGSEFSDSTFSAMKSYDGYLFVTGPSSSLVKGNLVIGTTNSTNAQIFFAVNGTKSENVVSKITSSGFELSSNKVLKFGDGSTQQVAAQPANYTQNIYEFANGLYAISNTTITNLSTANTWLQANDLVTLTSARTYTDTANTFIKNNYLANTTGTFSGNLNIAGRANVYAQMFIANSSYDYTNTALVQIVGSAGAFYQTPANPGYMLSITGVDGVSSRVVNSSYGTGAYALFAGRKGNGTAETPTAVANNDVIARFSGSGYNGTAFTATGQGRIDIIADEDFSVANTGSRIEFYNTIPKTNTVTKIATFNATTVTFTGAVNPQKGMILSPNNVTGITNTLNIDIANNSLYKITIDNTTTINLSGYETGKIVEVWMTNSSGTNRTVTHGCTAMNSSVNSTTFTIPATSSAYLKYFSIDGDNANTFVSINHA